MPDTNLSLQVSGRGWFGGLCALLSLALASCSNGEVITKRYELPAGLRTLTAYDNVNVQLVQDGNSYAEVRAGENVIDDIAVEVSGSALNLRSTSSFNWTRSYDTPREIVLHLPRLRDIFLRGQGNIRSLERWEQDTLFLHLIGAGNLDLDLRTTYLNTDMFELGDLTLRGQVEDLILKVGGSGRFFGQDLQARRCYFDTSRDSSGDAYVTVNDITAGTVGGIGTYYYGGAFTIADIKVTGRGRAVRR